MYEELKLCPFCGGKAAICVSNGVRVVCTECKTTTVSLIDEYPRKSSKGAIERVVEMWNRRANNETD